MTPEDAAVLEGLFSEPNSRTQRATAIYEALERTGKRNTAARILTYRCMEARCTLLDLIEAPDGVIVGFPRFKVSPSLNERTSNEAGRRKNTEDGWRRWAGRASYLDLVSVPTLQCDHVITRIDDEVLRSDLASRHTEVLLRRDGSRSVR